MTDKIPENFNQTVYIYYHTEDSKFCSTHYDFWQNPESDYSKKFILITQKDVEVPWPEGFNINDLKGRIVDGLRAQQETLKAEAFVAVQNIEDKIQQLLCLEYQPAAKASVGDGSEDEIPF